MQRVRQSLTAQADLNEKIQRTEAIHPPDLKDLGGVRQADRGDRNKVHWTSLYRLVLAHEGDCVTGGHR